MRNAWLSLVILGAAPWAAWAETGNFQIISGPGTGNNLNAVGGIVNGPGLTNGHILPPHTTLLGPNYHFHGLLNGNPDPFPDPNATGWGLVNYAPVPLSLFPATALSTMTLTQGASGLFLEQLFGGPLLPEEAGAPDPIERLFGTDRDQTAWNSLKELLIKPDAANAAAHVPQPAAVAGAAAAWERIQMTGPKAKSH